MQQPSVSCIESRIEKDNSLYGRFLIGPFLFGQGLTIANTLRRSLLSELQGLAITAIEIDGVNHEYSTIRGVRESVLDILLNIKKIVLTSNVPNEEPEIAFLQCSGPTIVLAKDIKFPNSIQCITPDQYIAALSFDGMLRIKFFICRGKNQTTNIFNNSVTLISLDQQAIWKEKKKLSNGTQSDCAQVANHFPNFQKKVLSRFSEGSSQEKRIEEVSTKNSLLTSSKSPDGALLENLIRENNYTKTKRKLKKKKFSRNALFKKKLLPSKQFNATKVDCDNVTTNEPEKHILQPLNYLRKNEIFDVSSEKQNFYFDKIKENKNFEKTKGSLLTINPFFAPVKKINFSLETDEDLQESRDRIILEIWTDGSILPNEALKHAAKAIINLLEPLTFHFFFLTFFPNHPFQKIFINIFNLAKEKTVQNFPIISKNNFWYNFASPKKKLKNEEKKKSLLISSKLPDSLCSHEGKGRFIFSNKKLGLSSKIGLNRFKLKKLYSFDLANIELSYRSYICLKRTGIETVGDFLNFPLNDLVLVRNFGKRSLDEIKINKKKINMSLIESN